MQTKIKTLQEIQELLAKDRANGLCIVQCHGVFDLLHPGHIRHIQGAKAKGDKLVVTLTPDRFVNKGPGRPVFNETLRSETLAALAAVDYVVLNDSPDAVSCIKKIRPSVYVKGIEYADHGADITGKISEESQAVLSVGGQVSYTDDIVFSSSSLLNTYFDHTPEIASFLQKIKERYTIEDLLAAVEKISSMKVLVVGDAIIDEYQYVEPLGQSGKGLHMTARCLNKEVFLGGALMVARHAAQFASHVTLLSGIGSSCVHRPFIQQQLDSNICQEFVFFDEPTTLTKKRYVLKDGQTLSKLFETYSTHESLLSEYHTDVVVQYLRQHAEDYDLIIAADFGNGFTKPAIVNCLSSLPSFLAVNAQTNGGNRGFNAVTKYSRADFVSVNELELRLAAHDRIHDLRAVIQTIANKMQCSRISVTQGVKGVHCFEEDFCSWQIPALTTHVVDRIGAGDSYLAMASLCLAAGYPLFLAGFFGAAAAAIDIQIIGNKEPVEKVPFCKFLTRLMK